MKKVLTILLTLALCLSLFVVAAAEEDDPIVIGQVFWACTTPTSMPIRCRHRNTATSWASSTFPLTAR